MTDDHGTPTVPQAPQAPKDVPILSVTGGTEGTEAHYAEMRALAARFDKAGEEMLDRAALGATVMGNGDLLESSILSPITFAKAEGAILDATTGTDGLTWQALVLQTDAFLLRTTVTGYEAVDALQHAAMEALDYGVGYVLGANVLPLALLAGGAYYVLPDEQREEMMENLQAWAEDHPGMMEHLINGGGGLFDGLGTVAPSLLAPLLGPLGPLAAGPLGGPALMTALGFDGFHPDTGSAAKDLAGLYDDGEPDVGPASPVDTDRGTTPPNGVSDLMLGLDETNDVADEGYVRIQTVVVDGETRYIAYIPGTDDMTTLPGGSDDTVRDMGANLRLMGGDQTAYGEGVVEAINRATAGDPDAHVMLVGHSQGGMTAAQIAAMGASSGANFTVDHVVTAGSPTAQVPSIPSHTTMLSLENQGDAIPLTDGEPNPDQRNRTTVRFDSNTGSISGNHAIENYVNGGVAVDNAARSSDSGSLHDAVASMEGYFGGQQVQTESVVITRKR
jgi:hypothetical protein